MALAAFRRSNLAGTLRAFRAWLTAPQPYLLGRWLCLRIVAGCFIAAFWALSQQVLGLIGSDGLAPLGNRLPWLSALGGHSTDLVLRSQCFVGVCLGVVAFLNITPKAAFATGTLLWALCLYELGPFDAYQPDAMLVSAGLCCAVIAPRSLRPGLGAQHPPPRVELFMIWILLLGIYWGSAVAKLQNPAWRSLTVMDHYWESAPVPAWTGWFVQTYLPHRAVMALCALVLAAELLGPLLLFGGGRSRLCFVGLNLALQLGIALTASYSFLNLLVMGIGMSALRDSRRCLSPTSDVEPLVDHLQGRWLLRSVVPSAYIVASLVMLVPHLIPLSLDPFRVRWARPGPGHFVNAYGLYNDVGRTGYRVEIAHSEDGISWHPYRYRCLTMDERARPGLVWPYQCRLDWFMWRVAKFGFIEDDGFLDAVVRGIGRGSTQVASLFDGELPRQRPSRLRVALRQFSFATPAERETGKWWDTRTLEVNEVTPPDSISSVASSATTDAH